MVKYRVLFKKVNPMKISVLIPCHNEEKSIRACVESCLQQTRPFDEIVIVDDGSTDNSGQILAKFGKKITVMTLPRATGNKSFAQERGLELITGDVLVVTDGDTILDKHFVEQAELTMQNPEIVALGGYVKSIPINWLTACRAFDYFIGQNFHKLAQSYINFMVVIPGAAGAFRTDLFKGKIGFDHDSITEDLDLTYKIHKLGLKIAYNRKCISYTQDPTSLGQYTKQVRRWYGGGFQNLKKHIAIAKSPLKALELSLMYIEGVMFSVLVFLIPILNIRFALYLYVVVTLVYLLFGIWAAIAERRWSHIYASAIYHIIIFINAYIFLEQFVVEIILAKKNLQWFQPERTKI